MILFFNNNRDAIVESRVAQEGTLGLSRNVRSSQSFQDDEDPEAPIRIDTSKAGITNRWNCLLDLRAWINCFLDSESFRK